MLTLIGLGTLLLSFCWALRRSFAKPKLNNVRGPASDSFFTGNMVQMFSPLGGWDFTEMLAEQFGRVAKIYGPFGSTLLHISDPKALYHILVKDQAHFEESTSFLLINSLVFGKGIASSQGEEHKKQRKMLTPVFSTAHMRNMVPLFYDAAKRLSNTFRLKLAHGRQEIDISHWMGRTSLELIGQCGLGYSFDRLVEGVKPHPFYEASKAFPPTFTKTVLEQEYILPTAIKIGSPKFRRWVLDHLPVKAYHVLCNIADIWDRTTREIFEARKNALEKGDEGLEQQAGKAKDLISILMRANMEASEGDKLSDEEVLAQMSTFAFAATDTTSNALSRALHLLATHPEVQERLRTEIIEAYKADDGDIPHDNLVALPFLDAVCRETLRLYSPVPLVLRVCQQDTVVPLSKPINGVDGRTMDSILVPKGTKIIVSIINANRDPLLWGPDSLEWKPERWLAPLPEALCEARVPGIYSHLLTFLGGGRACIGFKFSQLEMKVVLSTLVSQFRFYPPDKEIFWQMNTITNPTVKELPELPQLPLGMDLVTDV